MTRQAPLSKNAALSALCLGALILNVDTTIVTVAPPDLVRQTGATTTDLQWVVDAYSLTFGALITSMFTGRLEQARAIGLWDAAAGLARQCRRHREGVSGRRRARRAATARGQPAQRGKRT